MIRTSPTMERVARHLGVELEEVDAAAIGYEGREWAWPLAIFAPHLLRHRIVAIVSDVATLIAARAVSAIPVRTLWSGPVSKVQMGDRGLWHTSVDVDGRRVRMQSPDRDELEAALRGRSQPAS